MSTPFLKTFKDTASKSKTWIKYIIYFTYDIWHM